MNRHYQAHILKDKRESEAARALGRQEKLTKDTILVLITALQSESQYVRSSAAQALDLHVNHLYTLLPGLTLEQIQSLYISYLFPYSCKHVAPLYIQDNRLHFYTEAGLGQPIPLASEQRATLIQAFRAVRAKVQIGLLPEEESFFMETRSNQ